MIVFLLLGQGYGSIGDGLLGSLAKDLHILVKAFLVPCLMALITWLKPYWLLGLVFLDPLFQSSVVKIVDAW